jgi:hypothetical protein
MPEHRKDLMWEADPHSPVHHIAQIGNITYRVVDVSVLGMRGHAASYEVRGPRGGIRRKHIGNFKTAEEAKSACAQSTAHIEIVERSRAERRGAGLTWMQEHEAQRNVARRLIDIGYKELAPQLHPDKAGGSHDAMARLNRVRDKLKHSI